MHDQELRKHLLELLRGGGAHLDFDKAVAGLPPELCGKRPAGIPHTPWRLIEHMRIAQGDILEFCRNPQHVSPEWPTGYWPSGDAPASGPAWKKSVAQFRADIDAMQRLVADHNAYHLGQLVTVRRALGAWQDE